jgi:hypothetical protein
MRIDRRKRIISEQLEAENNCRTDRGREEWQNNLKKSRIAEQIEEEKNCRTVRRPDL